MQYHDRRSDDDEGDYDGVILIQVQPKFACL